MRAIHLTVRDKVTNDHVFKRKESKCGLLSGNQTESVNKQSFINVKAKDCPCFSPMQNLKQRQLKTNKQLKHSMPENSNDLDS